MLFLSHNIPKRNKLAEKISKFGWDGPWVVPFQYCVRQPLPPFNMAAVTKNRNFFNGHPRTIPPKFGSNWPCGFRGVD
jgi:hypothetical protein